VLGNLHCSSLPITAAMKLERNNGDDTNYDGRSFNSCLSPSPSPSLEGTDDLIELEDDFIDRLSFVEKIEVGESGSLSSHSSPLENNQTSMEVLPSCLNDQDVSSDDDENDDNLQANYNQNLETNSNQNDVTTDTRLWSSNPPTEVLGQQNENRCTFVISNVHGSDGLPSTGALTPVRIKQEMQ